MLLRRPGQLVANRIRPPQAGQIVLCDRYADSTLASGLRPGCR